MSQNNNNNNNNIIILLVLLIFVSSLVVTSEGGVPLACSPTNGQTVSFGFCGTNLPIQDRVQDLIGRLTLQEKVGLLVDNAAGVPRLGIQGYEWWSEALHGVSNSGPGTKFRGPFPAATSFPQVISTAATFNESLWEAIGRVSVFPLQNVIFIYTVTYIYNVYIMYPNILMC